jgi:hypothetical protein
VWRRVGPAERRADPAALAAYRLIWRPALAGNVGDGRPWTALMISLLSHGQTRRIRGGVMQLFARG